MALTQTGPLKRSLLEAGGVMSRFDSIPVDELQPSARQRLATKLQPTLVDVPEDVAAAVLVAILPR